jgi:hypothetical protein
VLQDILQIIFPLLMVLRCSTSDSYTTSRNLVECWAALLGVHPQNQHSICLFPRDKPIKNQRLLFFFFPRWVVCFLMRQHLFTVTHHFGISAFIDLILLGNKRILPLDNIFERAATCACIFGLSTVLVRSKTIMIQKPSPGQRQLFCVQRPNLKFRISNMIFLGVKHVFTVQ